MPDDNNPNNGNYSYTSQSQLLSTPSGQFRCKRVCTSDSSTYYITTSHRIYEFNSSTNTLESLFHYDVEFLVGDLAIYRTYGEMLFVFNVSGEFITSSPYPNKIPGFDIYVGNDDELYCFTSAPFEFLGLSFKCYANKFHLTTHGQILIVEQCGNISEFGEFIAWNDTSITLKCSCVVKFDELETYVLESEDCNTICDYS